MITQGAFNLLFRPGLRKDFRDAYDKYEPEFPNFLKQETTDKAEQAATIMTGPSRLYERGDGEPITLEDPKIGPKVMAVDKEYAGGFGLTRRTVEDDQYGKANQASKWLANAGQMTKEYRAAGFLDDAFTGTNFLGIDGLCLCSTSHTFLNATGTWANRPSTEVGLSVAGVTALMDLFQLMKDHNGDPAKFWPDTIVIGNSAGDYNRALQIFGSDREPFTAGGQDNPIKKRFKGMKIEISRFKSSLKSYFMIDSRYNDAHFVTRRPIEFKDWFDENTDIAFYMASTRFLIWFVDPRGWTGVNPT